MIVGTAGHIDHGKTTLVRALTGVDTDRLPEEKKRGISIELGYAFLDGPAGERLGFIDVPGHERLVHTMVAGATGIDHALLLVAADDGVMPQTREHLAVLSLLGVSRGTVVVTKADRAPPERVQAVCDEATALLQGSSLAGSAVLPVAALRGDGLAELRARLFDAARGTARDVPPGAAFRLAIDRAFTLAGVGTVVTGTVHAGSVTLGDELVLAPGDAPTRWRVKSLHAQNQAVTRAHAGQRCAVGLAGMAREQVQRGQWLVTPAAALGTARLDARLTSWHGEAQALRSGTAVHVHLGSAATQGLLAWLDTDALAPGGTARAQIVLRTPVAAWWGDRIVLRDASASRTLAGGTVLDPHAPARYRRTPQRLAELDALGGSSAADRLAALLAVAPQGVDLRRFAAAQGTAVEAPPDAHAHGDWALGAAHAARAQGEALGALERFHEQHPQELGPDAARLRRLALPRLPLALWQGLLADLRADVRVAVRGAFVHLPEHGVRLSAGEERIAQKVAPRLLEAGFEGAWARDLARDASEPEVLARVTLARLAQRGELHQVVKDLYYAPAHVATLAALARQVAAAQGGEVTAGAFRDATHLGRKRAIQLLEYFDRVGLLRRVGDVHRLRSDGPGFAQETT